MARATTIRPFLGSSPRPAPHVRGADLNRSFLFGGYGTDSPDRTKLTSAAIARASLLHQHAVDAAYVYVVGDTPLDVAATKAAGAVSVAVASGTYAVEALETAGADHVLLNLAAPFPGV